MKIIFHGAAQEVGKSCIELITNDKRYLLDAGVKFVRSGIEYPKKIDDIKHLDGIFLSHAHMDHSGALPMLEHKRLNCDIYCTKLTWKTINMLLEDAYHIEQLKHLHPAYSQRDIKKSLKDCVFVKYDKEYETKDKKIKFAYLNSGHIPGSCHILLNVENKKLLYAADMNTEKTSLMIESDIFNFRDIDILITECTYGNREHQDRDKSKEDFLEEIEKTLKKGGSVLLPVFGVGRSQEILMALSKLKSMPEIYIDGMTRKLTPLIFESNDPYVKDKELLKQMYEKAKIVDDPRKREIIAKKKGVVILTTSGMVQGGPVMSYIPKMLTQSDNSCLFSGFQARGTNGRLILEDKIFYVNHQKHFVKANVKNFDFSAHLGQDQIFKMIEKVMPKNLILQHGDEDAIGEVERYVKKNFPEINVFSPQILDEMEF